MKRIFNSSTFWLIVIGLFQGLIILTIASCTTSWKIENPYEQVDWDSYNQYKANFHTHTTLSDGRLNPHTVVDRYAELGYSILAITDHNLVTYPWTSFNQLNPSQKSLERFAEDINSTPESFLFENRDPERLKMIDIKANELSRHHHLGSFFNGHNGPAYEVKIDYKITEEETLQAIADSNGIAMLYHPGRYDKSVDWYVDLYAKFPHLIGMEVFNQGDRYPNDRQLWDSILTVTMPSRNVWGYSNDDMHKSEHIGRNWNVLILPELSLSSVRFAMEKGHSYFVYSPNSYTNETIPQIRSITVNHSKAYIKIVSNNTERILWIANGEVVSEGNIFYLNFGKFNSSYVRAEIIGNNGVIIGTQPFGVVKQ